MASPMESGAEATTPGGSDGLEGAGGAGGAGASGEGEYEVPEEVAMLLAMLGNEHAVRRGKEA